MGARPPRIAPRRHMRKRAVDVQNKQRMLRGFGWLGGKCSLAGDSGAIDAHAAAAAFLDHKNVVFNSNVVGCCSFDVVVANVVDGEQKGGTTNLRRNLMTHPLVTGMPNEVHFFDQGPDMR